MNSKFHLRTLAILLVIVVQGCSTTISLFDQYAYQQVTSLKVDALHIIDLAKDPIELHEKEVALVLRDIEKAREYELHRPKNKVSAEMWDLILDSKEGSFGGFLEFWRIQSKNGEGLGEVYLRNKKEQVGQHFNKIAELESAKIKE